jgi:hypothetical protein
MAKLVARVQHRQGFTAGEPAPAAKILNELRAVDFFRVKINQRRSVRIKADQIRRGRKRRGI